MDWMLEMHPTPWLEDDRVEKHSNWMVWRCGRWEWVLRTAEVVWWFGKMVILSEGREEAC